MKEPGGRFVYWDSASSSTLYTIVSALDFEGVTGVYQISDKQKKAVRLLWKGHKVKEIARMLGVHRTTLWRWFQHPEVVAYAQRYFDRETRRILSKPYEFETALDSSDAQTAQRAALHVMDLFDSLSATECTYPPGVQRGKGKPEGHKNRVGCPRDRRC